MKIDLKSMSRKELEKLLEDAQKALLSAQARDRRQARKAAEKAAAEFGFSLDDLDTEEPSAKPRKSKGKASGPKSPPQFANPEDKSQTWTGKGRQPNWFRRHIDAGMTPEQMKV